MLSDSSAFFFLFPKHAAAQSFKVQLEVAICNSNMVCEDVIGENYQYCPSDCEAPPPPPIPTVPNSGTGGTQSGAGYQGFGTWASLQQNLPSSTTQPVVRPLPITRPVPDRPTSPSRADDQLQDQGPAESATGIDGMVTVAPFSDRATLNFKTFFPSLLTISWGKTAAHERGIIGDSMYHQNFSKELSDLDPGTRYYYHIELLDSLKRVSSYDGKFITAFLDSKARLPIVIDFSKSPGTRHDELEFSWNIKPGFDTVTSRIRELMLNDKTKLAEEGYDVDGKPFVRLVRTDSFFPTDPLEGKVVYEGSGSHAADTGLVGGREYFYSIFLMDKKGNFSVPAIYSHLHPKISEGGSGRGALGALYDPLLDDGSAYDPDHVLNSGENELAYPTECLAAEKTGTEGYEASFFQDGMAISSDHVRIEADGHRDLSIGVDGQALDPEDIVSGCFYSHAAGRWDRYIFSKNPDGSRRLIFPALSSVPGGKIRYQFSIGVLKYKGKMETLKSGEIVFNVADTNAGFPIKETALAIVGIWIIFKIARRVKRMLSIARMT